MSEQAADIPRSGGSSGVDPDGPGTPRGRDLWQVPTLILSMGLLLGGLMTAVRSTPEPDHAGMLDAAQGLIDDRHYADAIEHLNEHVFPYVRRDQLPASLEARFHLLMARALYRAQEAQGLDEPENHENIVELYEAAEKAGGTLTPRDAEHRALALIALDRIDEAIEAVEAFPSGARGHRARVYRAAIAHDLTLGPEGDLDRASRLLSWFLADPETGQGERAWAVERQAMLMLDQGFHDDAISKLLREIQRLREAPPERLAGLFLLLARGYMETGAIDEAAEELARAESLLGDDDPRLARVHLSQGRIAERRGDPEGARELYRLVAESFSHTPERLPALLELGETEASLGRTGEALDAFRQLATDLDADRAHPRVTRSVVVASVLEQSRDLRQRDKLQAALRFAKLAESFNPGGEQPPEVVLAVARSHRALADRILADVPEGTDVWRRLSALDPSRREEARRHLIAAGAGFRLHADGVVLDDNEAYERSLWMAGDSFDLAGDLDETIATFQEYVAEFPDRPERAEARYRLGRTHQARGEHGLAAEYYRGLIDDRNNPEVKNVGLYADMSVVPLAQAYMLDDRPDNDAQAERLLRSVVEGEIVVQPDTPLMRDALVELGRLMMRREQFAPAIEQFETMLARFPDDAAAPVVRYRLAEAFRLDAARIGQRLQADLSASVRSRLETRRRERLERALGLYDRVVREIELVPPGRRSRLEDQVLRNAYFYRGSAAFDMGRYELAIQHYDTAFERYPDDPGSLVSLVQIVNAYIELGDMERARVANERAERFFRTLPDEVWGRPDLPMRRRDWERWLDSTSQLYSLGEES